MPFFSIILPTYNRAHYLERAIKSILFQDYVDWELLIIDDASTDNTAKIIKAYEAKTPGLFAAGDNNSGPYKQIVTAAGEGCKTALAAYDYLRKLNQR